LVASSTTGLSVEQDAFSDASGGLPNSKIEQQLDQERDMMFNDATLVEVRAFLQANGIPTHIDRRALDDVGIGIDMPLTFRYRSIRLRDGLHLLLREFDLTWSIRNGTLIITTPEEAESRLITKVYDVRNLVELVPAPYWQGGLGNSTSMVYRYDFDALIDTITATVAPSSWNRVGGPSSIGPYYTRRMRVIVVSQTYHIHREIDALLQELAKHGGEAPLPDVPTFLPTQRPRAHVQPQFVEPPPARLGIRSSQLRTTGQ
jgi:hypothetical protein